MVERFHRQLKCALKAQTNTNSWMDAFPLVLLGIRTSLKEDISSTAAELVYGTTLCLPGEYFTPTTTESLPDPSNYVRQLKALMQHIQSSPPRQPTNNDSNIPKGLATATHVFIRQDVVHKPLQPPYDGPFLVLKRMDKHYTIDINGRKKIQFPSTGSSQHTLMTTLHLPPTSQPLNLPPVQLALDDVFIFQNVLHHSCHRHWRGSNVVRC